ncbi:hypothetical protein DFH09DRAFT_1330080 [Mycena vulgaris]|nr:hypothetical protein DFH09DRAFT_1330080 [Mycena vulgaris]
MLYLRIPRASPLFTAVQGWRLTLDSDDSPDTFDFPHPPCEDESSGSGTRCLAYSATCCVRRTSEVSSRPVVLPGPTSAPHRAPVGISRVISIPARPSSPPPPIVTSLLLPSGDYTHLAASRLGPFQRVPRRLAALLSPPPAAEPHGVPSDVDNEWEEYQSEHAYDDVQLSPLVALHLRPRPPPLRRPPPPLRPPPFADREEAGGRGAAGVRILLPTPREHEHEPRVLRSRWSSSTLSSMYSAHAHAHAPRSPWTFAFARRCFPSASPAKVAATPMYPARVGKEAVGKGKGKRLTAADVRVLGPGSTTPSLQLQLQLASIYFHPQLVCVRAVHLLALPRPPNARDRAVRLLPLPSSPVSPPSAALYAAYTTQRSPRRRSPRRRAPTASASSRSESSAGHSGHSECSASAGGEGEGGLRRKPIPVGLFLR